jgi:hypothetical protein
VPHPAGGTGQGLLVQTLLQLAPDN